MAAAEIIVDGIRYVPSKVAASAAGIVPDYITKLARNGFIRGVRKDGIWYVDERSLHDFLKLHEERKRELFRKQAEERKHELQQSELRAIEERIETALPHINVAPSSLRGLAKAHRAKRIAHQARVQKGVAIASIGSLLFLGSLGVVFSGIAPIQTIRDASVASVTDVGSAIVKRVTSFFDSLFAVNKYEIPPAWERTEITQKPATTTKMQKPVTIVSNSPMQTIINQPVIERIQTVFAGLSEQLLESRLAALEANFDSRIKLMNYWDTRQADELSLDIAGIGGAGFDDIDIKNSTWTGGSISNTAISGTTLAGASLTVSGTTTFSGGLTAYASSTIGAGGQATGLTISGGATTTGFLVVQGSATSTFTGGIQTTALNITSTSATSTFANGIKLSGGCFQLADGTCAGTGSGGFTFGKSWEISSGALAPTTTLGILVSASSTIGSGTGAGGLTVSGNATTTGNLFVQGGKIGIGTPAAGFNAPLSFGADLGDKTYYYDAGVGSSYGIGIQNVAYRFFTDGSGADIQFGYGGSSAAGSFTPNVTFKGNGFSGFGTSTPYAKLTAWGTGPLFEAVSNASTTIFKIGQSGATTTGFAITNLPSALLATDANGNVYATTSLSSSLITTSGDWTGTFDGLEGTTYLANSFSTTSADVWKLNRNFFSTTSNEYWKSVTSFFATTSTDFWKSQNSFFSTTSSDFYVNASTTIPKAYSANTFTGANTFNGSLTIGTLNGPLHANAGVVGATTSIGVLYGGTGLTSAPSYGNILVGNSSGGYTLTATSSLGLPTFGYLFPSDATSTILTFSNGLLALASTTIGNGTQTGGLTISGGATTTGFLTVQGTATSTFAGGLQTTALNITSTSATSTAANGWNLTAGCFAVNGTCVGGGSTSFANPSASIGLTAVNGSASTAMRSDAAPALSQAILPTWTGLHQFTGGASSTILSVYNNAYFGATATSSFSSTGALTLASALAVGSGGTGATTLTGLLQGNGTSPITGITGTAGQFPYYNGTNTLLATSSIFLATSGNVGIGTTSPGTLLSLGDTGANTINISATATSTFGSGINIRTGCFAVNGTCVGGSSGYVKRLAAIYATSTPGSNVSIVFGMGGPSFSAGTLTLPASTTEMVVEVWGGGGGAGVGGSTGGTSCFGTNATACTTPLFQATGGGGGGGVGGTGSLGDVNLKGQGGISATLSLGGFAPRGGAGGIAGVAGNAFGGGGGGDSSGGGGGYSMELIFSTSTALSSNTYRYTVGAGGAGVGGDGAGGSGGMVITIYATSSTNAIGNDYAEMFPVSNPGITAGDIVAVDVGVPISMKLAQKGDKALAGVVATNPGQLLGDINAAGERPVALSGRVPVKVNMEGGVFKLGDRIAISSTPGVGMKAGPFDDSVGIVIGEVEHGESGDTVMIFLDLQRGIDINAIALGLLGADAFTVFGSDTASSTVSTATSTSNTPLDFVGGMMNAIATRIGSFAFFGLAGGVATSTDASSTPQTASSTPTTPADAYVNSFMHSIFARITEWFANIGNGIDEVFARIFNASEKICVDGECLTKDDIRAIKAAAGLPQTAGAAVPTSNEPPASPPPAEEPPPNGPPEESATSTPLESRGPLTGQAPLATEPPAEEPPAQEQPSAEEQAGAAEGSASEAVSEPAPQPQPEPQPAPAPESAAPPPPADFPPAE